MTLISMTYFKYDVIRYVDSINKIETILPVNSLLNGDLLEILCLRQQNNA